MLVWGFLVMWGKQALELFCAVSSSLWELQQNYLQSSIITKQLYNQNRKALHAGANIPFFLDNTNSKLQWETLTLKAMSLVLLQELNKKRFGAAVPPGSKRGFVIKAGITWKWQLFLFFHICCRRKESQCFFGSGSKIPFLFEGI